MPSQPLHISILSGEHSGDMYAEDLIHHIKKLKPDTQFSGMGGPLSYQQGLQAWPDCQTRGIMGFTQAFMHFSHYRKLLKNIENQLRQNSPDLLILIDYAGLNLKVAKIAHFLNIKVFYYIPPKVWAWGQSRLKKIQKFVTCVGPLYPFESDYFSNRGVQTFLIPHPFLKKIPKTPITPAPHTIALLPGSRLQEINTLLPIMLETCYLLLQSNPAYQFKVFCSESNKSSLISQYLDGWKSTLSIQLITHDKTAQLQACRLAIICSGTATFECAMLKVPMVVIYRTSWINYLLIRLLVRVQWASLPNLILQRSAFIELLQSQCQPESISKHAHELIQDGIERQKQSAELDVIYDQITNNPNGLSLSTTLSKIFTEHLDIV